MEQIKRMKIKLVHEMYEIHVWVSGFVTDQLNIVARPVSADLQRLDLLLSCGVVQVYFRAL